MKKVVVKIAKGLYIKALNLQAAPHGWISAPVQINLQDQGLKDHKLQGTVQEKEL